MASRQRRTMVALAALVAWSSVAACSDHGDLGGYPVDASARERDEGAGGPDASRQAVDDAATLPPAGDGDRDAALQDPQIDGGAPEAQDTPPTHALNVTASRERHRHAFLPRDADPGVPEDTFSGDNEQVAEVDPRAATMVGKLLVNLGGAGSTGADTGGMHAFAVERGFHVFAVAYRANYDILIGDPDYYGDARLEAFDGVDRTSAYAEQNGKPEQRLGLVPADGVYQRVTMGLRYLHAQFPDEDWAYYLDDQQNVRWSDVIFAGFSHGASSAARYAKVVRLGRVISLSGPRDNTCDALACSEQGAVVARWFGEPSKTPIERYFALTGGMDGQHTQHLVALRELGYLGEPVDVDTVSAPYQGSHRLVTPRGGHGGFCGDPAYRDVCNYMLGVPEENAQGLD